MSKILQLKLQLQNIENQLMQRMKTSTSYCDVKILQLNNTMKPYFMAKILFFKRCTFFYSIVMYVYNLILENCKNILRKYIVVAITIYMITHISKVAITETKKLIKTNHPIQRIGDLIKYFRELNLHLN